jgi:hypothetical protein
MYGMAEVYLCYLQTTNIIFLKYISFVKFENYFITQLVDTTHYLSDTEL